jgi:HD superfamily phosphodiesterase
MERKDIAFEKIIEEAQDRLRVDPFDAGHDLDHHKEVVANCLLIVQQEKLEGKIVVGDLLIAAWWHDYKRNNEIECDKELSSVLIRNGFDSLRVSKILEIKNSHSYGNSQEESIEAKVLFDGDKIEYVNCERWQSVAKSVDKGEMTEEVLIKYAKAFSERIVNVPQQLHFEISKKMFTKKLIKLLEYLQEKSLWTKYIDRADLENLI